MFFNKIKLFILACLLFLGACYPKQEEKVSCSWSVKGAGTERIRQFVDPWESED